MWRRTRAAVRRVLAGCDRITERAFCAGPVDRLTIGMLHMPVIHLGFCEAGGGAVLLMVEVVR